MFDGKTFLPVTGMPMRKIACMSRLFALAEPVPLTVPILNAKSLTGIRHQQLEASHVPRRRRTTLGAETAVEADVLVLHHDALGLGKGVGGVERLGRIHGRRREVGAEVE